MMMLSKVWNGNTSKFIINNRIIDITSTRQISSSSLFVGGGRLLLPRALVDINVGGNSSISNSTRHFSDKKKKVGNVDTEDKPLKSTRFKMKKRKKGSIAVEEREASADKKETDLLLSVLDAPAINNDPDSPLTEEEKQRRYNIGRNYVIGCFRKHNEIEHDLACKIQMKKHAIKMLPKNTKLKDDALTESETEPPPWRHIPAWTPPIPGYDPSKYTSSES